MFLYRVNVKNLRCIKSLFVYKSELHQYLPYLHCSEKRCHLAPVEVPNRCPKNDPPRVPNGHPVYGYQIGTLTNGTLGTHLEPLKDTRVHLERCQMVPSRGAIQHLQRCHKAPAGVQMGSIQRCNKAPTGVQNGLHIGCHKAPAGVPKATLKWHLLGFQRAPRPTGCSSTVYLLHIYSA